MKFTAVVILYSCTFCTKCQEEFQTEESDFSQVVKSATFVDKTLMIEEFFRHKNMLVTVPRRFGKTTNMDMIRRFCELQVDTNGTEQPREETENFKIFTQNNLKILTNTTFFHSNFGRHPVIYLNFKELIGRTFQYFLQSFRELVFKTFKPHKYLLASGVVNGNMKNVFELFFSPDKASSLKQGDLDRSIKMLASVMHLFYKRKVTIFIDDIDYPIKDAIFSVGSDSKKIIFFLRIFLSLITIAANYCVNRVLINSCQRVLECQRPNIWPWKRPLDDPIDLECLAFTERNYFTLYYGLTEDEVVNLAKKFKMEDKMASIREWYGGYISDETKSQQYICKTENCYNITLYNTYSVVKYFESRVLRSYWAEQEYIKNFHKILSHYKIQQKFYYCFKENNMRVYVREPLPSEHMAKLNEIIHTDKNQIIMDDDDLELCFQIMLDVGYFTVNEEHIIESGNCFWLIVKMPNKEIENEFKKHANFSVEYFKKTLNNSDKDVQRYVDSVKKLGDGKDSYMEYAEAVANLFRNVNGTPEDGAKFHGPLYAYAHHSKEFSLVEIGVYVEEGCLIDMVIIKKDKTGIMIEMTSKGGTSMMALDKIIQKSYHNLFDSIMYKKGFSISCT